jgi:hypothetical protein
MIIVKLTAIDNINIDPLATGGFVVGVTEVESTFKS